MKGTLRKFNTFKIFPLVVSQKPQQINSVLRLHAGRSENRENLTCRWWYRWIASRRWRNDLLWLCRRHCTVCMCTVRLRRLLRGVRWLAWRLLLVLLLWLLEWQQRVRIVCWQQRWTVVGGCVLSSGVFTIHSTGRMCVMGMCPPPRPRSVRPCRVGIMVGVVQRARQWDGCVMGTSWECYSNFWRFLFNGRLRKFF